MSTPYKQLDKLNPNFKKKVDLFIENCKDIFLVETYRTQKRQDELIGLGLSKIKHSNHQDGLAIDIGFYGSELYPTNFNKWRKVADIAKQYGIEWGYDLWKWDKPHFQDNGLPLKNLISNNMDKALDLVILTNSVAWDSTSDKKLREILEKHNAELRNYRDNK